MPTPEPIPAQFDPAAIERAIYAAWMDAGLFHAPAARSSRLGGPDAPFVIIMPPPNVTGVLHMGHGLNNTVQDVLVRWRRMAGDATVWVPGTDHAGIATQNVVEKQLAKEGRTRFDLGREAFVERVKSWVAQTGGEILSQLRSIGASADWQRTAYTLDPGPSSAVREVFVRLFEEGLIYRGHRVIHWCPRCLTSLSDEEAEFDDASSALYHIDYPLVPDSSAPSGDRRGITVATTRPETMLGDVAVAVHPGDERYRDLVGRQVMLPVANVPIPVLADDYSDPTFGSGAVKITPAHDANDFEVGLRHRLPMPVIMTPDGRMDEGADADGRVPAALRGMDRFAAREWIVETLREQGRLVKIEPHRHAVRHCYRCETVVEPRLSDQWFVRMKPLAAPALEAVRAGRTRILPDRWEGVYTNWMENIRDWNISRQLWWGHRIPVWYCDACDRTIASRVDLAACPDCGGAVRQDEDVLDTWFSSWLWPFSTLGWPNAESRDLKAFYPSDVLVTAPEILFFWVARMMMAGFHFMGDAPFHTVYLTGTARDTNHVRMQKSLGNGIDPLDVVRLAGADALRYTVVSGMGLGADLILDPADLERSFAPGRNFCTKLWNIGRFLLANVGDSPVALLSEVAPERLTRADRWILGRLGDAIAECDAALGPPRPGGATWDPATIKAGLRLSEYAESARRFVWNELADWYLESTKPRLSGDSADREVARSVMVHVLDQALRLLHPVVPFITEALWQRLPGRRSAELLAGAQWPRPAEGHATFGREFELVRDAVSAVRQIRAEYSVLPGASVSVVLAPASADARRILGEEAALIGALARASVRLESAAPPDAAGHAVLGDGTEVIVPLAGAVDLSKECGRLKGELDQLDKHLASLRQRLGNESFTTGAPASVVQAERDKEREWSARRAQLGDKVKSLCGG